MHEYTVIAKTLRQHSPHADQGQVQATFGKEDRIRNAMRHSRDSYNFFMSSHAASLFKFNDTVKEPATSR